MSKESQGDGDSIKTDDETKTTVEAKFTKDDLTNKFRDGYSEGTQKGVKDTISVINKVLGTEFDSVEALESSLPEVTNQKVEESEVVQSLQSKLKEKDEAIQNLSKTVQDFRVSGQKNEQYQAALGDNKLKIDTSDAVRLFETEYGYVEENGTLMAVKNGEKFLTDDGQFATLGDAFGDFVKRKNLIEAKASGGAGGGTSAKAGTDRKDNPFVTGNLSKQAELYRTDQEAYQRLKKEANK